MTDSKRWFRDDYRDAVWEDEVLTVVEKAIAETYARHVRDEKGDKNADARLSWVTYDRLMAKAGIRKRAFIKPAIDRLVALGWMKVEKEANRRATLYRLMIPSGSSHVGTTTPRSSDVGTSNQSPSGSSDVGTTVVPTGNLGSSRTASGSSHAGTQPLRPQDQTSSCADPSPSTPSSPKEEGDRSEVKKTADRIADRHQPAISFIEARRLAAPIKAALLRGWTADALTAELDRPTDGLRSVAAGLIDRASKLANSAPPPAPPPEPMHPDAHEFQDDGAGTCRRCPFPITNARHRTQGDPQ